MADPQALARDLAEALYELEQRDLWRDEGQDVPPFLIDLEGEDHAILAMFTAAGNRGLMLVRGEGALEEFEALVDRDDADFDQLERSTVLQAHVSELDDVPPLLRGLSRTAGLRERRHARVPVAVAKPPGRGLRSATREEMELMLHCVQGILFADEQGEFSPEQVEAMGDATLELTIRRSEDEPHGEGCGATPFDDPAELDELDELDEQDRGDQDDDGDRDQGPPAGASERA